MRSGTSAILYETRSIQAQLGKGERVEEEEAPNVRNEAQHTGIYVVENKCAI